MRNKILLAIAALLLFASGLSAQTPYAVLCEDQSLHFLVSDTELKVGDILTSDNVRISKIWNVDFYQSSVSSPDWCLSGDGVQNVIFEESFSKYKPTSCKSWLCGYHKVTEIDGLEYINTEDVTDMSNMFYDCTALISLDLSTFNTSKVKDMTLMFSGCHNLKSLNISSFKTENLTSMAGMFCECKSLISIDVSKFNTKNVNLLTSMFQNCDILTEITLGENFDTAQVTDMCCMFTGCPYLTSLDLKSFNTENVTDMHNMFSGCTKLKSLDISHFNTENVTDMHNMFSDCNNLKSLDISNFNTKNVTNMNNMFSGCKELRSLDISNFNTTNTTDITNIFANCTNLRTLILGKAFKDSNLNYLSDVTSLTLVFVNQGTLVPEGRANVVVGDQCEHLVINYGETSNNQLYWQTPYDFTAEKVTINRAFEQDRPYTLYMPFAMDAAQYGTFYTGGTLSEDGRNVTFSKVTDTETDADTPYMFIPKVSSTDGITIESPVKVIRLTGETEKAGLQGVNDMKEFTADEAERNIYYGWAKGEFHRAEKGAKVDACRAYFRLPDSEAAKAPALIKAKFGEEDTTGVTEIASDDNGLESPTYNLNGQRVGEGYRGIVVKKGAKTVNISR